jgi:hypothetical protein
MSAAIKQKDLIHSRLNNQQVNNTPLESPAELVSWMGAVQAQDYAMAKWAIGLRIKNSTDEKIERAISSGEILRTHVLRPTWHFVHANDIRWMLKLTAPQIQRQMAYYDRQLDVDKKELSRSVKLFEKTLMGKKQNTRKELSDVFLKSKFNCEGMRFGHLLMHAELNGILCSGGLSGKNITYTLLEERVKPTKDISKEEALAKLAQKYFQSHGPATVKDFSWWSGLPITVAREAVALLDNNISSITIEEENYFYIEDGAAKKKSSTVILLPNYDEYIVGYSSRDMIIGKGTKENMSRGGNPVFENTVLVDGVIAGTWKREIKKESVSVTITMFDEVSTAVKKNIDQAEKILKSFILSK